MSHSTEGAPHQAVAALALMEQALALLDEIETPTEVAAHLDLAIARLRDALPATSQAGQDLKWDEWRPEPGTSASPPKPFRRA